MNALEARGLRDETAAHRASGDVKEVIAREREKPRKGTTGPSIERDSRIILALAVAIYMGGCWKS